MQEIAIAKPYRHLKVGYFRNVMKTVKRKFQNATAYTQR